MNPSVGPPGPPALHNTCNGYTASTNATFSEYGMLQHATAPARVATSQVQAPPYKIAPNNLIDYRTWLSTQSTQTIQSQNVKKPGPKKPKRFRTGFTTHQLLVLEKEYARAQYLPRPQRIQLAEMLQLNERCIKIWYQNRRMKEKKEKLEAIEENQELMVPYPEQIQTYPAATTPIVQNYILEHRHNPQATYEFTKPESCQETISSNLFLQQIVQDLKLDEQQQLSVQFQHPVAATIKLESAQYFGMTNGVTQPVNRPVSCEGTIPSNLSLQGIIQNLQIDEQQYIDLAAANVHMQSNQYHSSTNGFTQPVVRPVNSEEIVPSKFSLQKIYQNLQHGEQQYSNVRYRHPAAPTAVKMQASQMFISKPNSCPVYVQRDTQPILCPEGSKKTVSLKSSFEEFGMRLKLEQQFSGVQYRHPVLTSEQVQLPKQRNSSPSMYEDPSLIVHQESTEENSSSLSSVDDIYQNLILTEKQFLEAQQRDKVTITKHFIPGQLYSPCTKLVPQHTVRNSELLHPLQTEDLSPDPGIPSDLEDVSPMRIEIPDLSLYLV